MKKADIGLVGLAVMGENLVMNMESKGFTVAVFNRTVEKVDAFVNGRGAGRNFIPAHSLEELAAKMDVPFETLKATVDRYNELCAMGDDPDFGKRPELLTTVVKAPFYAVKMGSALLDVMGGCLTNKELNVLDADYQPIPGLYAVGNVAGGLYGVDYPLLWNGNSHSRCLTWARAAVADIAGDSPAPASPV